MSDSNYDSTLSKALKKRFESRRKSEGSEVPPQPDLPVIQPAEAELAIRQILEKLDEDKEHDSGWFETILEPFQILLNKDFRETIAACFEFDPKILGRLEIHDLPLLACTEATVSRWIKERAHGDSAVGKRLTADLVKHATQYPGEALKTALASWVCRTIDAKQIRKLVPLVAADLENPPEQRLIEQALLRDKNGDFATAWLRDNRERLESTASRIHSNPKLLRHVILLAPKWIRHPHADVLPPLYVALMQDLPGSQRKQRAEASGRLLSLAGALVPVAEKSKSAGVLLHQLQQLGLKAWKDAAKTNERHRTWAFIQSGNRTLTGDKDSELRPDQAKHLGIALMRARKGKDPLVELESAAINLGGVRFGEVGETTSYDATIHNDLDGGLLPGDPVVVVRPGLRYGGANLVKVDVREPNTD